MSAGWLLLNIAYVVYTGSAIFKEILYLRVTLLAATFLYIAYGVVEPNWSVFYWNLPVVALHSYAIWQLLQARRGVSLDEEADAIRRLLFPELDRVLFNSFWHTGQQRIVGDDVLIVKDTVVKELILILDGEVEVDVSEDLKVRLSHFRIVGEMSTLSGDTASATVTSLGIARLRCWDKDDLYTLGRKHPEVENALLKAMGQEVARKLN